MSSFTFLIFHWWTLTFLKLNIEQPATVCQPATWTIEDKEAPVILLTLLGWLNMPPGGHPKSKHEIGSSFFFCKQIWRRSTLDSSMWEALAFVWKHWVAFVIEMYSFNLYILPGWITWSSSHDFYTFSYMCLIFSERLIVNVEVVFWSIRKLSEWSVLSVEIDLHALCRACVDLGGGLLTHISIMLASISHIWPKFWPIAIKFIKVSDTHSGKITYGSSLATKYFYDWVLKNLFVQSGSK